MTHNLRSGLCLSRPTGAATWRIPRRQGVREDPRVNDVARAPRGRRLVRRLEETNYLANMALGSIDQEHLALGHDPADV